MSCDSIFRCKNRPRSQGNNTLSMGMRRKFNICIWCFDREHLCGTTALIKLQSIWYFERFCICLTILYWSTFDLHLLTCIHIYALFILVCCNCADYLFHILNDLLLELPFATSKKKGLGIVGNYEIASCKLGLSTYIFWKYHGHRIILCVNWKQLLAQKDYEKKDISLQARFGFSQNWWCPNQFDFQFFIIAIRHFATYVWPGRGAAASGVTILKS